MNRYFKTFSNCILVKGYNRSTINDVQRNKIYIIPNDIYYVIEKLNKKIPISDVLKEYDEEEKTIIKEAIEFMVEEEYGFYCDYEEYDLFTSLNTTYSKPHLIDNIIIEFGRFDFKKLQKLRILVEELKVRSVSFVFYFSITENEINEINEMFKYTTLENFEIYTRYDSIYKNTFFENIERWKSKIEKIVIFNSPEKITISYEKYLCNVYMILKDYDNFDFCGSINSSHFDVNKDKVLESINFNSCLNKKLAIDREGNIKNCPVMRPIFGNIRNISEIKDIVKSRSFKKLWKIKKDEISICKDCEFRHVCTDCRVYIEDTEDLYSKPSKCGYNPYTNEWG